jgi:hypothetical protein
MLQLMQPCSLFAATCALVVCSRFCTWPQPAPGVPSRQCPCFHPAACTALKLQLLLLTQAAGRAGTARTTRQAVVAALAVTKVSTTDISWCGQL